MGVGWPGCAGAAWKRAMVSGVRSTCRGDSDASLAAPLKSIEFIRLLNCSVKSCSAPGRLHLTARRSASAVLLSCLTQYGTRLASSTVTQSTWPLRLTPTMPPVASCGAVTKMVSAEIRFM